MRQRVKCHGVCSGQRVCSFRGQLRTVLQNGAWNVRSLLNRSSGGGGCLCYDLVPILHLEESLRPDLPAEKSWLNQGRGSNSFQDLPYLGWRGPRGEQISFSCDQGSLCTKPIVIHPPQSPLCYSMWVGVPCYPCHGLPDIILAVTGPIPHMQLKAPEDEALPELLSQHLDTCSTTGTWSSLDDNSDLVSNQQQC